MLYSELCLHFHYYVFRLFFCFETTRGQFHKDRLEREVNKMENIDIGDLIVISPPGVNPPVTVHVSEIACSANGCNNEARAGRCSECKQTRYCSIECQAAHWNDSHQGECQIGIRLPWKRKAATPQPQPAPPKVVEFAPGRGRDQYGGLYVIQRRGGMTVTMPQM